MIDPRIEASLLDVPDFPTPGVIFKDITPMLADPEVFNAALEAMIEPFRDLRVSKVAGIEARGFVFAAPIGLKLNAGVIPVRKPGKLPREVVELTYSLEYGSDTLQIHRDSVQPGERVLVVDDVLATGGTAEATVDLLRGIGADVVGLSVLLELAFLGGRSRLDGVHVNSVVCHDGS